MSLATLAGYTAGIDMKKPEMLTIGLEKGADGYSAGWCLELPGCFGLIPPGFDEIDRMELAILEFASWSHNRAAERLTIDREHLAIVQVNDTGELLADGDTSAFFLHDAEPAGPREFPGWANAHDLALDELRDVALSLPGALLSHRLGEGDRNLRQVIEHAAVHERWFAVQLLGGEDRAYPPPSDPIRDLQSAHRWLQEAVCDVPPAFRARRETSPRHGPEDWSVRKVMRRSIWHLRYHTAEIRRSLGALWLA